MANDFLKDLGQLTESVNTTGRTFVEANYSIEVASLAGSKDRDITQDVIDFLRDMHAKLGQEQLEFRLDTLLMDFAADRNLVYDRKGDRLIFYPEKIRGYGPFGESSIDEKKKGKGDLPAAFLKNIKGKGGKPKGDAKDDGDDKKDDKAKGKNGKKKMPDFIQKKIDASKKKKNGKKKKESIDEQTLQEAGTPIKLKLSAVILGGDIDGDKNTAIKRGELDGMDLDAVNKWLDDYWTAVMYVLGAAWSVSGKEVVDKLVGTDYQDGDYSNVFLGEINRGSDKYDLAMERLNDDGFDTEVEQLGMDDVVKAAGKDLKPEFKYLAASVYVYVHPEKEIKDELDYYETMRDLEDEFDGATLDIDDFEFDGPVPLAQLQYAVNGVIATQLSNMLGGISIKDIKHEVNVIDPKKGGKPGAKANFDFEVFITTTEDKDIAQGDGKMYATWGLDNTLNIDTGYVRFLVTSMFESIQVRGNPAYMTTEEKRRATRKAR